MTTPSPQVPPFGDKRKAAMAVYTPPFKYQHGYIFDSQHLMVADNGGINDTASVEGAVAARVRGWGRLGYLPNGAELQDEIGQMMADALNALYTNIAQPVQPAVTKVLSDLVSYTEGLVCTHESTHRGGAIWEICDDCGAKWADDRGGKPKHKQHSAITNALAAIESAIAQPVPITKEK